MKSTIKLKIIDKQKFVVNWDELPKDADSVAIDRCGDVYAYTGCPIMDFTSWVTNHTFIHHIDDLDCKVLNWKDTVRYRKQSKTVIDLEIEKEIEYTVDWSRLPDEASFVVIEYNGDIFWHKDKPTFSKWGTWDIEELGSMNGWGKIESLNVTVSNPQETLIERPQPKPKYLVGDMVKKHVFYHVPRNSCTWTTEEHKITSVHFIDNVYYYKVENCKNLIAESEIKNMFNGVIRQ